MNPGPAVGWAACSTRSAMDRGNRTEGLRLRASQHLWRRGRRRLETVCLCPGLMILRRLPAIAGPDALISRAGAQPCPARRAEQQPSLAREKTRAPSCHGSPGGWQPASQMARPGLKGAFRTKGLLPEAEARRTSSRSPHDNLVWGPCGSSSEAWGANGGRWQLVGPRSAARDESGQADRPTSSGALPRVRPPAAPDLHSLLARWPPSPSACPPCLA
ncbi:hypothetical protein CDD83_10591 [Cordyceps sp. RAO-2017]|nr:hypothetical protein CDD83_10591 [Cordyceps sp. RAO-2017]